MNDILPRNIRKRPPRTQEECLDLSVRDSLARYGELPEDLIRSACEGMAKGLFGPAFEKASPEQKEKWVRMAERRYRLATKPIADLPYTHHGPAVYGSKMADYLVSEAMMRDARLLPDD